MPNEGKARKRGKRAGKKVHERQQRAAERSKRAERISDSELPSSPQSPPPASESHSADEEERSHRGAVNLKERSRSRTPIRRIGSPRPTQAPREFYVKPSGAPKAPSSAARVKEKASSSEAPGEAATVAAGGVEYEATVRGIPSADWRIAGVTFRTPSGKLTTVAYDPSTGRQVEEAAEEPFQEVEKKKKIQPPKEKPPPPKTEYCKPKFAFNKIAATPKPKAKKVKPAREKIYPGKDPTSTTENPGISRKQLAQHLQSQGIRGSALDVAVLGNTKSSCSTCISRRRRLVPALKQYATEGLPRRRVWKPVQRPEPEPIPAAQPEPPRKLRRKCALEAVRTEEVAEVPPPPKREPSSESESRESPASVSESPPPVPVVAGIDFHLTLDPELVQADGTPTPEDRQKQIHERLVESKKKTGCIFHLHTFSGKATGQNTIATVKAWEDRFEASSGGRVFDKLTFAFSVIRDKHGRNGKASIAKQRGYDAIFDDDLKVCQRAEGHGLAAYLVDYSDRYRRGYTSIYQAINDFTNSILHRDKLNRGGSAVSLREARFSLRGKEPPSSPTDVPSPSQYPSPTSTEEADK